MLCRRLQACSIILRISSLDGPADSSLVRRVASSIAFCRALSFSSTCLARAVVFNSFASASVSMFVRSRLVFED